MFSQLAKRWWLADNCSMFATVNILKARSEAAEEIIQ